MFSFLFADSHFEARLAMCFSSGMVVADSSVVMRVRRLKSILFLAFRSPFEPC